MTKVPEDLEKILQQPNEKYLMSFDMLVDEILLKNDDSIKKQFKDDTGLDDATVEYVTITYTHAFREGYKACALLFKEALTESEEKSNG